MRDEIEKRAGLIDRLAHTFLVRDVLTLRTPNATDEEKDNAQGRIDDEIRRLESFSPEELHEHAEKVLGEFYHLDKAHNPADFPYWAKAARWSLFEGACLVSGEDPRETKNSRLKSAVRVSPRSKRILDLYDLAVRAYQAHQLYQHNTPQEFLQWTRDLDYQIPRELERLVSETYGPLISSKERIAALEKQLADLATERDSLKAELEELLGENTPPGDGADPKLSDSDYWRHIQQLVTAALNGFPIWEAKQKKVQRTGNLQDWLVNDIGADNREAEIIKKILSEKFRF